MMMMILNLIQLMLDKATSISSKHAAAVTSFGNVIMSRYSCFHVAVPLWRRRRWKLSGDKRSSATLHSIRQLGGRACSKIWGLGTLESRHDGLACSADGVGYAWWVCRYSKPDPIQNVWCPELMRRIRKVHRLVSPTLRLSVCHC